MKKVLKFGGTSLADAKSIKRVKEIIESENAQKFIVVSAPGKRFKEDEKITDLLYQAFNDRKNKLAFQKVFGKIKTRFEEIINELELSISLEKDFEEIERKIKQSISNNYAASRGEYIMGKIMAELLKFPLIDAAEVIHFNKNGTFNLKRSEKLIRIASAGCLGGAVFPGFYGKNSNGEILTFSRGGSDYTGAVVAAACGCDVYENWTDVNGFLTVDPGIVEDAKLIELLSFRSLRDLSYMGASVLHSNCVFPLKGKNIPIIVKNTFNPNEKGTKIIEFLDGESGRVDGITGKKDLVKIVLEKPMLKNKLKWVRALLAILRKFEVDLEQTLTSVDTMSVVIEGKYFREIEREFLAAIQKTIQPDKIIVKKNLANISVVGGDLSQNENLMLNIFIALSCEDVRIRMVEYGSSRSNILIGVNENDFEIAIKHLYEHLF